MKKDQPNREWSTEERLQELRGKLNLKERDNEAFYRYSQENITANDDLIKQLRAGVKHQREVLQNCLNFDREVIRTALHGTKLDQLAYQRATAIKCIEEKNQDVFDQVKKLNSLKHQMKQSQDKIAELELTLKNLKAQQVKSEKSNKNATSDASDQRIRVLSTKLDKVLLKINSARYVNITYKRLLSYLEKDSLTLPGRLDELEACLEQQKSELQELRKIHSESKTACDSTKQKRKLLEDDIMAHKQVRDKKITTVRRTLKTLNDESDNAYAMVQQTKQGRGRSGVRTGDSDVRQSHFTPEKVVQKQALADALGMLKDTVGASSIEDIACNFETQLQTQEDLLSEAENLQVKREHLLAAVANMEHKLNSCKYDDSVKLSSAHVPEKELENDDQDVLVNMAQLEQRLNMINRYMATINTAFNVFYEKACELDGQLPKDEDNLSTMAQSMVMRFGSVVKMFDSNLVAFEEDPKNPIEPALLDNVPSINLRIELPEDDDEMGGGTGPQGPGGKKGGTAGAPAAGGVMFGEDDDELVETQYFSRDDLKKKPRDILNKAKPKKRH